MGGKHSHENDPKIHQKIVMNLNNQKIILLK